MHIWGLTLLATTRLGTLVAFCTAAASVGGALVGLIFRGAAAAWREERDAAVEKAERLDEVIADNAEKISQLEKKVADLEKRTNIEAISERSSLEHRSILDALSALEKGLNANTTAVEFLLKQVFPTAVFGVPRSDAA
jgi:TolA-binding protein